MDKNISLHLEHGYLIEVISSLKISKEVGNVGFSLI